MEAKLLRFLCLCKFLAKQEIWSSKTNISIHLNTGLNDKKAKALKRHNNTTQTRLGHCIHHNFSVWHSFKSYHHFGSKLKSYAVNASFIKASSRSTSITQPELPLNVGGNFPILWLPFNCAPFIWKRHEIYLFNARNMQCIKTKLNNIRDKKVHTVKNLVLKKR